MFQKLVNPTFSTYMRPLLQTDSARALNDETLNATFVRVMNELIDPIPGDEWAKAGEMRLESSHPRTPAFHSRSRAPVRVHPARF